MLAVHAGVKRWLRGTPQGVAAPAEDLPGGMQLLLHRSLQDGSRSASEVLIAPGCAQPSLSMHTSAVPSAFCAAGFMHLAVPALCCMS